MNVINNKIKTHSRYKFKINFVTIKYKDYILPVLEAFNITMMWKQHEYIDFIKLNLYVLY